MGLFTPAWKSKNENKARKAIERIKNQKKLKKIAMTASWGEYAVEKLTDEAALAEIALKANYASNRYRAVKKITNKTILAEIALKDESEDVRRAAVKKITNQTILAEIALKDEYSYVREAAVKNITNQTILAEIALKNESSGVRRKAIKKLTDQDILTEIARSDEDAKNRVIAYKTLNICPKDLNNLILKKELFTENEVKAAIKCMEKDRFAAEVCWEYLEKKYKKQIHEDRGVVKHDDCNAYSNDCGHADSINRRAHTDHYFGTDYFPPYPFKD